MRYAIVHLNYVSVLVVAAVGFILGWLWYTVLFGKAWVAEMKITPEQIEAAKGKGMAGELISGFILTLVGTWGLAMILFTHGIPNWKHGAAVGAFVGAFVSAARYLNFANWEKKSTKLRFINAAHEVVLYTVQGAILGLWH